MRIISVSVAALVVFLLASCSGLPETASGPPPGNPPASEDRPPPGEATPPAADFGAAMVAAHNTWRAEVGVPPLRWSEEVADYAQAWATTLEARGCELDHRPDGLYGENLAWAGGTTLTPRQVVGMWGEEKQHYNHSENTCRSGGVCGHYTQVVWRDTEAVGCGQASCGSSTVWVCNYDPPGNWSGQRPY